MQPRMLLVNSWCRVVVAKPDIAVFFSCSQCSRGVVATGLVTI